jgi:phage-related protein (TIGR01555 family)
LRGGSEGDAAIRARLSQLQYGRSVARAVAVDAERESFEYVSRSFSGYDSGLYALMFMLSASSGIPVTLLFGRSPAGLNSTGESDIKFFYDSIKSEQELRLLKPLRRLLEVIMSAADGPTSGNVPETWSVTFKPLMQSSPLERADIRLKTAQADQIELELGVLTPQEIADSHYGGDEYDQDITLDKNIERGAVDQIAESDVGNEPV